MSAAAPINTTRQRRLRYAIRVRTASSTETWPLLSQIPELHPLAAFEKYGGRLEQREALCLVAEADWRSAGCFVGYSLDERTFVHWLGGVLPEYRGCGIARTLLQEAEYLLAERGFRRVEMKALLTSENLLRLLESEGYERIGVETSRRGQKLLYTKRLSPIPIPVLHPLVF